MFGIGFMELCLIAVVALVFVGPTRLPEVIKQVSRLFVQVRHMSTEVRSTVNQALADAEQEIQSEKAIQHIQDILAAPEGVETHQAEETTKKEEPQPQVEIPLQKPSSLSESSEKNEDNKPEIS